MNTLALINVDENTVFYGGKERNSAAVDYYFIGVPFDSTSSFFPGSRFAPKILRYLSYDMETNCIFSDKDFDEINVYDLGDIIPIYDTEKMLMRIEKVMYKVLSFGKKIIAVGGEHTITLPMIMAFIRKYGNNIGLITFDAHFDLRDRYPYGQKYSHATVMRRIGEIIGFKNMFVIGVRAYEREEKIFAVKNNINFIASDEINRNIFSSLNSFILNKKYIYLSIDVDVCNISTGNPEMFGLKCEDVLLILKRIRNRIINKLTIIDIVEYNPLLDHNYSSGITVNKIIMETAGLFV